MFVPVLLSEAKLFLQTEVILHRAQKPKCTRLSGSLLIGEDLQGVALDKDSGSGLVTSGLLLPQRP